MVEVKRWRSGLLLATLALLLESQVARADCAALMEQFSSALASSALDRAIGLEKQIYTDDVCTVKDGEAKQRLMQLELQLAGDANTTPATRDMALADLRRPATPLHAMGDALALADRLFERRRFGDAEWFYGRAIALAGPDLSDAQKTELIKKASAAKLLADNDDQGRAPATYTTTRAPDGSIGGVFSPSLRGVEVVPVPLPINFVYNSAEMTAVGRQAAAELAEALKQQNVSEITLIGHTDPRGQDQYNVKLSESRVHKVAEYLAAQGLSLRVKEVGKGWHEPFDTKVLPYQPSQEEAWALDRRVELLR